MQAVGYLTRYMRNDRAVIAFVEQGGCKGQFRVFHSWFDKDVSEHEPNNTDFNSQGGNGVLPGILQQISAPYYRQVADAYARPESEPGAPRQGRRSRSINDRGTFVPLRTNPTPRAERFTDNDDAK